MADSAKKKDAPALVQILFRGTEEYRFAVQEAARAKRTTVQAFLEALIRPYLADPRRPLPPSTGEINTLKNASGETLASQLPDLGVLSGHLVSLNEKVDKLLATVAEHGQSIENSREAAVDSKQTVERLRVFVERSLRGQGPMPQARKRRGA